MHKIVQGHWSLVSRYPLLASRLLITLLIKLFVLCMPSLINEGYMVCANESTVCDDDAKLMIKSG